MTAASQNGTKPALQSDWGGLSEHLIATFFAIKSGPKSAGATSKLWVRDMDQPEVRAPITDGNVEAKFNWISPFENVGVDQKFSSLSAMLQSGALTSLLAQFQAKFPDAGVLDTLSKQLSTLEGKSNLTKLNSTQVFQGMPPVNISVTAHFRAFRDARTEVRDPLNQLMQWAMPKKIAPDGVVGSVARGEPELFPSEVPQLIGMKFADTLFAPLVIESIPYQLTGPRDANGILTHAAVPMQIATLTAMDRKDWEETYGGRHPNFNY